MKVLVLGATGGTGREMVRRALDAGHAVTAFVRNPEPLDALRGRVRVLTGDLLSVDGLAGALAGQDGVLSGFGPRLPVAKTDAHLLREFATALTAAMRKTDVRRAVLISTAFLFKDTVFPPVNLIGRLFFSGIVKDSAELEAIVQESGLEWTLVRPPELTNGPFTGRYRERVGHLPVFGIRISRADVADYFVRALERPALIRTIVGISN